MNKRELGKLGEKIAVDFLKQNGYKILEKNFWCRYGEIDIIAKEKGYLVFVEVKLSNTIAISPQEQVNYSKRVQLAKVANYYLCVYQINKDIRFDVVAIANYKKRNKIKLFRNAFYC